MVAGLGWPHCGGAAGNVCNTLLICTIFLFILVWEAGLTFLKLCILPVTNVLITTEDRTESVALAAC